MTVPNDRFWAKVLFKEFIRHFRKLDDSQIVEDIHQSMDDLDDLNEKGTSFGSKMVQWSMDRKNQYPNASENGAKGGRPPANIPPPRNREEVIDFASEHNLPIWAVEDWWQRNYVERPGCDQDGVVIKNWKGAFTNHCKNELKKEKEKKA